MGIISAYVHSGDTKENGMTPVKLAGTIIRVCEGCKLEAYWDKTGKVWTIGFGTTLDVKEGDKINLSDAYFFLERDSTVLVKMLEKTTYSNVAKAALISFGYNCGAGALARVIGGDITAEEDGFYTKEGVPYGKTSGGKPLVGLDARRKLECALILNS